MKARIIRETREELVFRVDSPIEATPLGEMLTEYDYLESYSTASHTLVYGRRHGQKLHESGVLLGKFLTGSLKEVYKAMGFEFER